ncbi:MAG: SpoIID/LytB domain-containing protein [Candidatus Omnitrophota bacterium]
MKLMLRVLFLALVILAVISPRAPVTCDEVSRYVRVELFQDERSLRLKLNGPYEITDVAGKILSSGNVLKTTVIAQKGAILLGEESFKAAKITIKVTDPDVITVNDRMFRGEIQFMRNKDAALTVINRITLEDYVKGILYHEASHYWPMEALKVQAIISRTYALYQMEENKAKDYDVTSDIYSQVYGGKTSERYRTNRAVEETRSRVLIYQDKVFPAYFSATCAGHTEDASMLWNIDILPLKGVVCGFCKDSPHFYWHYVLTLEEIQDRLMQTGKKLSPIKDIVISGRNKSGRIIDLKIVTSDKELKISAKDFRDIFGPNVIRSTHFKVDVIGKDAVFEGIGWGHGVGLCQWGAYFMAKKGQTAEAILKYYYAGSQITSY